MFQKNKRPSGSQIATAIQASQIRSMKIHFPTFQAKHLKGGDLEFTGELRVRPELPVYRVSITYRGHYRPYAKVISPTLVDDRPHFYKDSGTLCLYHRDNYEWKRQNSIAKDIVPWVAAWIYFYEAWLEHGEWLGPEAEHDISKFKEDGENSTV